MDQVTSGLKSAAAYIDDVFVFSKTWEEHLSALDSTLARLVEAGLKCKLSKCSFGGDSVKCLGQLVSEHGVTIDEDKVQAIRDLPRPADASGMRSFLGMVNYFRSFIEGYADISAPLSELVKKGVEWEWTAEREAAFLTLKAKLSERPVLAMPDFKPGHKPFILHTDWSKQAIGAVLLQEGDDKEKHAVAFASRILTSAERNYAPTEGECLAVVWAVKKFRHYLHGRHFDILTDHSALKWLQEARFTNSKLERWALAMQEHDYSISHVEGKKNVIADCLSRVVAGAVIAWEAETKGTEVTPIMITQILNTGVDLDELSKSEHADMIRCAICKDPGGADNMVFCSGCNVPYHLRCHLPPLATVPIGEWLCLSCNSDSGQLEELIDPDTPLQYFPTDHYLNASLMECVRSEDGLAGVPPGLQRRSLRRFLKRCRVHPKYPGWLQVRTRTFRVKSNKDQPWRTSPPLQYRWGVIRMFHDMLGHAGIEHTHRAMSRQIYWPGLKMDVTAYCLSCMVCQQRKAVMYEAEGLEHTELHGALKHIHADLAGPFKLERKTVTFEATVAAAGEPAQPRSGRARSPARQPAPEPEPEPGPSRAPRSPKGRQPQAGLQSRPEPPPFEQHWIVIIIDYFTKAAELVAVPSKSAETIARALYDHWFCRYGVPTYITTDNGTEFAGEFTAMLDRMGCVHVNTAVRHPQANGVCERLVGTIKEKLYKYCNGHPTHWKSYLPRLRYAYMQGIHGSTHFSPFELVYGFTPHHPLPVNISLLDAKAAEFDKSYLDLVMLRHIVDADLCRHVEQLQRKHVKVDSEVRQSLLKAQNQQIEQFYSRRDRFHNALPTAKVGDYVFEIKESPKPMRAIADGPFQVVARNKDQATLRTGVTKWDPVPKEFTRKVDLLAPCLTRKQAWARANGRQLESTNREAPLKYKAPNALLEVSFDC